MSKNWLAVASAEHVRLSKKMGIMQVCHGKIAPLKRITPMTLSFTIHQQILSKERTSCNHLQR
ncbi:hypothetical protein OQJ18_04590 [Fluoribacter dumoffii]|uniref:hypothetical protein n=1 Tax=Fluoribacter dumoffii TaxID=463 RepID=UPI0022434F69|nr:hypothetical protein [Fluoribacter dumoffii]MCW8418635.1 hypothetical protein [Fluoribacter dumoffii]MCW8453521.1 hypothetical protein [Fluoribacter dumoffii]MCW8459260.1 hypothetical protein [Fluoribacter dumoffii]MCW8482619.1 hypothetical protein [Fluoribacter dumoffii]